jgi:hypothetical protein
MAVSPLIQNFSAGYEIGTSYADRKAAKDTKDKQAKIAGLMADTPVDYGPSAIPEAQAPEAQAPQVSPAPGAIPAQEPSDPAATQQPPVAASGGIPTAPETKEDKETRNVIDIQGQIQPPADVSSVVPIEKLATPAVKMSEGKGMKTADWAKWRKDVVSAASATGDPAMVAAANKYVTDVQHQGFIRNANMASSLMASGSMEKAVSYLKHAYKYFPDGASIENIAVTPDGKSIVIKNVNETTGEPNILAVTPELMNKIVGNFKDPMAFSKYNAELTLTKTQTANAISQENRAVKKAGTDLTNQQETQKLGRDKFNLDVKKTNAEISKINKEMNDIAAKAKLLKQTEKATVIDKIASVMEVLETQLQQASDFGDGDRKAQIRQQLQVVTGHFNTALETFDMQVDPSTGRAISKGGVTEAPVITPVTAKPPPAIGTVVKGYEFTDRLKDGDANNKDNWSRVTNG